MNYRHEFHAGNFADVVKHVVLTRILVYLARKPAPFRVVDTHAGAGSYALHHGAAARTGEWRNGLGRLDAAALPPEARELIGPYLALTEAARRGEAAYPGSPFIAASLTRPLDRLIFCDLHADALASLRTSVGRDKRAKVVAIDGYVGLNAFIPPVERRGLVLIDPPFEAVDEFARLTQAVTLAHAKWSDGIFLAWFPIKRREAVRALLAAVPRAGIAKALAVDFCVDAIRREGPLSATGLLVINPPYVLEAELRILLPALLGQLALSQAANSTVRSIGVASASS